MTQRPALLSSDGPLNVARRELNIIADSIEIQGKDPAWGSNECMDCTHTSAVASWASSPTKLVFQTQCNFAESYSQLKGRDRVLTSVLHATGLLDVHVVKVETARGGCCRMSPAQLHHNRTRLHRYPYGAYDHGKDWPNYASIDDLWTETVTMKLDLSIERVQDGEGKEPNVESYFRRCVLVVWPQSRSFLAACMPNLARALASGAASLPPRGSALVLVAGKASVVTLTKTMDYCHAIAASDATQRDEAVALRSLLQAS
ncbi:hypothetical protein SPRG_16302 [Saprolegnia parasitica CBS 223.65]|uniref:Uncharacterized protein n=1 Tax=Saprolegnia parasitica (strain CBS 223.65) TaxID=695850 RepID=A0A067BUM0_SAPPC|nr:hypothetical protein SPRG_16302 [Saprolegnia parasitica CBS 223.65]KDO18312.1 hypothetical protein SPRG_16302 [Saprolegnia parasitica CBS 223.65]|eukprot:XP_012210987.1 hypothetical protein SPRG_16302 [Saprolegnia parasitica CBS 223.65]